tara:strand:+ start:9205 stop:10311 length:1107 start_codon:yes stop_codon:yes gene_type:complete
MSYNIPVNTSPSKILYIDSRDAFRYLGTNEDGNDLSSYFTYILREPIEIPTNQRALLSLQSATIPYSFYNIRFGVNDILSTTFTNTTAGTTADYDIRIIAGNYTAYSLSEFIKAEIETRFGSAVKLSMDYSTDTMKYTYSLSHTGGNTISLLFKFKTSDKGNPYIEMGFDGKSDITILSTGTTISPNVSDLNGSIHGVYIRTNLVSNGTLDSQTGSFANILARLPINVNSGGIIFSTPNNATHKSLVDLRSLSGVTIRLTDERNRILDLNGLHFQIAISIDFVYAEKPIHIAKGGNSATDYGNSFTGTNDSDTRNRVENFFINKKKEEQEEILRLEEERKKKRVGRPRNVGRPKGSRTKITQEEALSI